LQSRIRQLERALEKTADLHAALHKRYEADRQGLLAALKDAVALIDLMQQRAGRRPLPLLDGPDILRLEAARLLSLGV